MTALVPLSGVPLPPVSVALSGTGETDIFTNDNPTDSTSIIQAITSIAVINNTGGAIVTELEWYDGASDFDLWRKSVPTNDTLGVEHGLPLYLAPGQKLKAVGNTGITITVSSVQLG